jgi:hypothetical protein
MKKLLAYLLSLVIALPLAPLRAEEAAAPARPAFTQAQLDQMLAPIALYPDELLSQVLMASTYPLEVVEAARWSRAHADLKGDEAVRSAADQDWDPSVKSLLAFPDLLQRMDEKLEWTRGLGEAFLAQESQVMDTVQQLRHRAEANGSLAGDGRVRVVEDGGNIAIEPANPQVVYVPYYDPWVVYGAWWWPAYPPVVWAPWPGYVVVRSGFWWGVGIGVTAGFFFGAVSWPYRHVTVVRPNVYYARPPHGYRPAYVHRPLAVGPWQYDPTHRRGVSYRNPEVRQRYGAVTPRGSMPRSAPLRAAPQGAYRDAHRPAYREDRSPERAVRAPMPPAWRSSGAPSRGAPRETAAPPARSARSVPYDRGHGSPGRFVDRPDGGRGARANAPQYGAAQSHGFAGNAGRHAGAFSVRPAVRGGMAGGGSRMGR